MTIVYASIIADLEFWQIVHRTIKVVVLAFFDLRSELGLVVFLHRPIIFPTKLSVVVKLLCSFFIIRILSFKLFIFRPYGLHFLLDVHFHLASFYWIMIPKRRDFAFIVNTFLRPSFFAENFGVGFSHSSNRLVIRFLCCWEA